MKNMGSDGTRNSYSVRPHPGHGVGRNTMGSDGMRIPSDLTGRGVGRDATKLYSVRPHVLYNFFCIPASALERPEPKENRATGLSAPLECKGLFKEGQRLKPSRAFDGCQRMRGEAPKPKARVEGARGRDYYCCGGLRGGRGDVNQNLCPECLNERLLVRRGSLISALLV